MPSRFKVPLKTILSAPIVDGKHSVFQVLGSSESYRNVSFVVILVALAAPVDRNVNSQDFGSS